MRPGQTDAYDGPWYDDIKAGRERSIAADPSHKGRVMFAALPPGAYGLKMAGMRKRLIWQGVSAGASALSVVVMQRVITIVWRRVRNEPPPDGPGDQKVSWSAALTWAIAMGVGIAVARLVAVRLSEDVWEATTHEAPPGTTSSE
jgi:hypothetical protein